jgi:hypothetical protein
LNAWGFSLSYFKSVRLRWRAALATAAIVVASGASVLVATPAHAASCSDWHLTSLDAGPAAASVWISDNCSDDRIHLDGTVWDQACDSRSARLILRFFEDGDLNGRFWLYRTENVYANGGCNTSVSYAFNTVDRTTVSNDMYVNACVLAQNSTGSSSQHCRDVWTD